MNAIGPWSDGPRVFMRSLATRDFGSEISAALARRRSPPCKAAGFDLVIVETSGIGQGDAAIVPLVDVPVYVMTPEFGAASQLEKIDMLDFAEFVVINKFDRKGAADALRDVAKQVQRNREAFGKRARRDARVRHHGEPLQRRRRHRAVSGARAAPRRARPEARGGAAAARRRRATARTRCRSFPVRARATSPTSSTRCARTSSEATAQARLAREIQQLRASARMLTEANPDKSNAVGAVNGLADEREARLDRRARQPARDVARDAEGLRRRRVRGQDPRQGDPHRARPHHALGQQDPEGRAARVTRTTARSSSGCCSTTCRAAFPYTAGTFAFKRENEDPTRMFAGEGDAFRTNRRFKLLSAGMPAKRLSTAFDSVTLYGNDPARRPDIYGKVGNSGVSIATLDDMKVLYSGFDLHRPEHLGEHDDQRPGADDPGDVHEHRDRPEARQVRGRQRPRADRRRDREDRAPGSRRTCAARCRPTS